jgi:tetratricopeptide (TPR) repeat protein
VSGRWPVAGGLILLVACVRTAPPPPPTAPPPAPIVAPEPPPPKLDDALAAKAAGKLDEYDHILRVLANSPEPQTQHRALALLALHENTVPLLEQAADAYPEVAPWLRLRIIELDRDAARFPEAIASATRILQEAPTSSAATIARVRLPALHALANDANGAEAAARDLANVAIDEQTEEEFVKVATALDKAGRADLAASIRMRLLTTYPQGRFTEQTYAAAPIDTMNINDALVLARRLSATDHYDEAIDLMRRIEQRDPKAVTSREYQTFRLRALFNSRHYDDVLKETNPRKLKDPVLILLRARAAWRADEPEAFLAGLKRVERLYPKSPQAAEAKLLRAKYYSVDDMKLDTAAENLEKGL